MDIQGQGQNLKNLRYAGMIQSNCEYLTVIKYANNQKLSSQKTLEEYMSEEVSAKLNYENFVQLFIQSTYLIFSCKYYNIKPEIDKKDVRVQQTQIRGQQKQFSIIIYYNIIDEGQGLQYINIINALFQYLLQFQIAYAKKNPLKQNDYYKEFFKVFVQQYAHLANHYNYFSVNRQKQFFLCLEETTLFRKFSLLLKIKNKSILNYLKPGINKLKQAKKIDVQLTNEWNNEKKKVKGDIDELNKKEKAIEDNIKEFFKFISGDKYEFKLQSDQSYKIRFIFRIKNEKEKSFKERLKSVAPNLPQFQEMAEQVEQKPQPTSQYYIEFAQRNLISVKFILDRSNVNMETSDFLMFLSNILSFESTSINIEAVDAKQLDGVENTNKAITQKFLAFKGCSSFNTKEPMLQKILVLMDLTMISAFVSEPELALMRSYYIKYQNYSRFIQISQKVNHYTKIFLRCAKKVYNE